MRPGRRASRLRLPLLLLTGLVVVVSFAMVVFRPDRPVPTIEPGSSSGPAFVVQVIRPRLGLPVGGLLPPALFGHENRLLFDSSSAGATVASVGPGRIELRSDDWELDLVLDADGRPTPDTRVVFEFLFEENMTRVVGRPGDPVVGTFGMTVLADSGELAGNFDIEIAHCEYAGTGEPLGWPPEPLVLHGSFDRLAPDTGGPR